MGLIGRRNSENANGPKNLATHVRFDFTYDHERDVYQCPGGTMLTTTGTLVNDGTTMLYRALQHECAGCALKPRCCPNTPARKIPRSIHEGARDMARQIAKSWEGATSRRLRKKVEMLFAHLKRILKLDRLRLRGVPALTMSSSSQPLPRTLGSWRSWYRYRASTRLKIRPKGKTGAPPKACSDLLDLLADFFNRIGQKQTAAPSPKSTVALVQKRTFGGRSIFYRHQCYPLRRVLEFEAHH